MATEVANKLEGRWLAFVTSIALFFGGWWIQNQYEAVMKTQQQLSEYAHYVDDKYVQKDYMGVIIDRLDRIETKVDELKSAEKAKTR